VLENGTVGENVVGVDEETRREIYELHANLCKALADPKRLLLINALRNEARRTVGELSQLLGLSQSNVSQHLGVLRQRGVVTATREGNHVFYVLDNPKIVAALDLLREVMAEHLRRGEQIHEAAIRA
jgi:ArsR family transcriptional regulator, virulence genes transcriptional regulator